MSEKKTKETPLCCEVEDSSCCGTVPSAQPPGFFKRIFSSIDEKMKAKAEGKANVGDCCGGDDSKGDKCC